MIEIRARVANLSSSLDKTAEVDGIAQTVAERLIVEISGADIAPIRFERHLDFSRPTILDSILNVPIGRNLSVEIWAVDENGAATHIDTLENQTVNIEAGVVTPVFATLIPAAGSIYLQFIGLPTNSSVHADFISFDGAFETEATVNRATRTFLNLDGIPHLTAGTLTVTIYSQANAGGDILRIASCELTFNARSDNSIDLEFSPYHTGMSFDLIVYEPGVTTGSYDYGNDNSSVVETGELIITEIMWSAGNSNYIELYNIQNEALFFDTLIVDVNNNTNRFTNIEIAPHAYFVIGRQDMPHVDVYASSTSAFAITSTGNWITVKRKDGTVIDRVICGGTGNTTGWPTMSSTARRSIELAKDKYNAIDNNFGKNWHITTGGLIPGTTEYGTPGY
ncbi:MAG: lamin tail domain-containing protein [Chitinispirillales bacterium]|nr:lamin tail domain-containing protein [Chitinispirillales bacterium]